MKFTELSVTESSNTPEKVLLDGFKIELPNKEPLMLDGQWVEVIGVESDVFKDAELSVRRDLLMGVKLTQPQIDRLIKASLIVGWSFEEECTTVNKVSALQMWPQNLTAYIVRVAEGRVNANFIKKESKPS